jgi:DNA-binding NtrC family response regulator
MKARPNIFVIEDNPFVQDLIEFRLKKKLKCIISKFSNSEDAFERMKVSKPDLIVLDHQLDKYDKGAKDGLKFLQELKSSGAKIPTIVLSGQTDKMVAVELIRKGAIDYVSKDSDEFLKKIEKSVVKAINLMKLKGNCDSQRIIKQRFFKRASFIVLGATISLALVWLVSLTLG